MIRYLFIFLTIFIHSASAQEQLNIVASASMISDMAQQVIGPLHKVDMIVPIGGDPHLHEPTPSDVRLVAKADLILVNGLTFEGWITELIDNSGTSAKVITVTDGILPLTSETYKNSFDPHAWMDASNALTYVDNITDAIIEIDSINTDIYKQRAQEYRSKIIALDQEISSAIQAIPAHHRILITSHDAFQYYGKRYGIKLEAIMGLSTEAQVQTSDITRVNQVIREQGVPAIFVESTINPKMMQQIAQDNDVAIGGKLYADSLGDQDSPASTYIEMLRYNTQTIVAALNQTVIMDNSLHKNDINYPFVVGLGIVLLVGLSSVIYLTNRLS